MSDAPPREVHPVSRLINSSRADLDSTSAAQRLTRADLVLFIEKRERLVAGRI
jgi:hypothetical protein